MTIHFDEELKLLKQKLLGMADTSQEMIRLSVQSLHSRDQALAKKVLGIEDKVNHFEIEIEEEVLRLLATRQPAGKDLRLLVALLKINNDLERIADQACNISETVLYLLQEPPIDLPLDNIVNMAGLAQKMVHDSIGSFVYHKPDLAKVVCESDDEVDWLQDKIFRMFLMYMMENPKSIVRSVDFILISRSLERIADHATNIGEEVIFIEQGKNIKHHIGDEGDDSV